MFFSSEDPRLIDAGAADKPVGDMPQPVAEGVRRGVLEVCDVAQAPSGWNPNPDLYVPAAFSFREYAVISVASMSITVQMSPGPPEPDIITDGKQNSQISEP